LSRICVGCDGFPASKNSAGSGAWFNAVDP
jgi:hypothetical protein